MLAVTSGEIPAKWSGALVRCVVKCLTAHSCFTNNCGAMTDTTDDNNSSDEQKEGGEEGASVAGGKLPILPGDAHTKIAGSRGGNDLHCTLRNVLQSC